MLGVSKVIARSASSTAPASPSEPGGEDGGSHVFAHLDQNWGQRETKEAPTVAVSDGEMRYVMFRRPDGKIREQLYDSGGDGLEGENIAAQRPEDLARMRSIAEEYLDREPVFEETTPDLELDEMQLNQLRALGYAVP